MANGVRVFDGDPESPDYSDDDVLLRDPDGTPLAAMEPLEFKKPSRWRRRPSLTNLVVFVVRRAQNGHFRAKLLKHICLLIAGYLCLV